LTVDDEKSVKLLAKWSHDNQRQLSKKFSFNLDIFFKPTHKVYRVW